MDKVGRPMTFVILTVIELGERMDLAKKETRKTMKTFRPTAVIKRATIGASILALYAATCGQIGNAASYRDAVLALQPHAFWELNETGDPSSGTLEAVDSTGNGYNGIYGPTAYNAYYGILGPQPPTFKGFATGQGAVQCSGGDPNSTVSLPPLNLSSEVVDTTIIMWIYPNDVPPADTGLFFDRSGGTSTCGFGFHNQNADGTATELGYNWNDNSSTWGWSSRLYPPLWKWSFAALVVETNRATIYLFYLDDNGQPVLLSAVNSGVTHRAYNWSGSGGRYIGRDPLNDQRIFPGIIDGVAIFNRALTQDEILGLFAAGVGVQGFAPMIGTQPQSYFVYNGARVTLEVTANGSSPLQYQWQLNGVNIDTLPNATNYIGINSNVLTILSATSAEAGSYRVLVSNPYGSVYSSPAILTIQPKALVGRWFTDDSLADVSGFTPAGTHDAVPIGGMMYEFTNDVPAGKTGKSVLLSDGASGFAITNSSALDPGYTNTFDARINYAFSVVVWAKGWPGNWDPFVSKYGESGQGWQIRQAGDNNLEPCWTIRGTGGTLVQGRVAYGNPEDLIGAGFVLSSDTNNWHLYVGTYDAGTGERCLYVDGQLAAKELDNKVYTLATNSFLCIGARDNGGQNFGNWFVGQIYDVRIYNYALSYEEVLAIYGVNPPSISVEPNDVTVVEGVPVRLQVTAAGTPPLSYQWQLNGTNIDLLPNATNFVGIDSNVLTILRVTASEVGRYRVVVTNLYGSVTSREAVVSIKPRALVGRWFAGTPSLADVSGFRPAGTHDGYVVGGNYYFTNEAPPGLSGQSLVLNSGVSEPDTAIVINNTSIYDPGYTNTFDEEIDGLFTVAFWAKGGLSDRWLPWVSKYGENGLGWQLRNGGWVPAGTTIPCWTVRGGGWGGGEFLVGCGPTWSKDADREDLHAAISGAGEDATYYYTDNDWHLYVGTFNVYTGERKLYIDGILRGWMINNPPNTLAPESHIVIGGRDTGGGAIEAFTACQVYDVRIYNYELSEEEIRALMPDPVIFSQPPASVTGYVGGKVTLAARVGITEPITNQWQLNGVDLVDGEYNGTIIIGAKSNVLTMINLTTNMAGVYRLVVSNPKGIYVGSNVVLSVVPVQTPPANALVGAWFCGEATLADVSGYTLAGTHDGYKVGTGTYVFTNDVPPGKPAGYSLALLGNCAIAISNSSTLDPGYVNTFDDGLSAMTVMFWAKGIPGSEWNPFVSKYGESGEGWQLRRDGASPARPCWTLRGTGGAEDMSGVNPFPTDGEWHHYAGTFDPITGVRCLYVDGVLVAMQTGQGPYTLAQTSHLVIGGRDNGGDNFGNWFVGQLYDVRIYNVALTEAQINSAVVPEVVERPAFVGLPVLQGDKLIINWTRGTLLQATNIFGPWVPVTSTPPYTNDIMTAPQLFFRLRYP